MSIEPMGDLMSAEELFISEGQRAALVITLAFMEGGKLTKIDDKMRYEIEAEYHTPGETFTGHFYMSAWNAKLECGTVACIGGTAELLGKVDFFGDNPPALDELFYPRLSDELWDDIGVTDAAKALRNYLTFGEARWSEVLQ